MCTKVLQIEFYELECRAGGVFIYDAKQSVIIKRIRTVSVFKGLESTSKKKLSKG
jgi:hypothetical protein